MAVKNHFGNGSGFQKGDLFRFFQMANGDLLYWGQGQLFQYQFKTITRKITDRVFRSKVTDDTN